MIVWSKTDISLRSWTRSYLRQWLSVASQSNLANISRSWTSSYLRQWLSEARQISHSGVKKVLSWDGDCLKQDRYLFEELNKFLSETVIVWSKTDISMRSWTFTSYLRQWLSVARQSHLVNISLRSWTSSYLRQWLSEARQSNLANISLRSLTSSYLRQWLSKARQSHLANISLRSLTSSYLRHRLSEARQ